MRELSKEMILKLHRETIIKHGGLDGVRDEELLLSSIYSPYQTFGGEDLYPTIIDKSARMSYLIVKNHPFVDGNKRTAFLVLSTMLVLNNITLFAGKKDIVRIFQKLASGEITYRYFLVWVKAHTE